MRECSGLDHVTPKRRDQKFCVKSHLTRIERPFLYAWRFCTFCLFADDTFSDITSSYSHRLTHVIILAPSR